jgi:nicotinamidase-related amidase
MSRQLCLGNISNDRGSGQCDPGVYEKTHWRCDHSNVDHRVTVAFAVTACRINDRGGTTEKEALLIMDVQNGIVERYVETAGPLLSTLADLLVTARRYGVPVIFVRVAFHLTGPIVSDRNKSFTELKTTLAVREGDESADIHPVVSPLSGEVVVTKRRVSAFSGSDLDSVLRTLDINALVLTGIATSGVVLSTLRQAADLDYRLTVISDGCIDSDPEVHGMLTEKLFPRQASVMTAREWAAIVADR